MSPTTVASYPRTQAYSNQAGGSIKTTSATNVAAEAAARGVRTLFLCLDSQCNGSKVFGYEWLPGVGRPYAPDLPTIHEVMLGKVEPLAAIRPARYRKEPGGHEDAYFEEIPNLDILVGSQDMADADHDISNLMAGVLWLRNLIEEIQRATDNRYELIVLDAPASLGKLMVSILVAATEVIGCVLPGGKEIEAIVKLEYSIAEVQRNFGKFGVKPELTAILVGRISFTKEGKINPFRGKIYQDRVNELRGVYGELVKPLIREDVRVPESYDNQTVLRLYDPGCAIAEDYACVADALGLAPRAA